MIDNINHILKYCDWKDNSYYRFFCISRNKDNGSSFMIKTWMIDSEEELLLLYPRMKELADIYKARIYMNTDRKSLFSTLLKMQSNIMDYIKNLYNSGSLSSKIINKIPTSASAEIESSDKKMILFDIDSKDKDKINILIDNIYKTFSINHKNNKEKLLDFASRFMICDTVQGFHLVVPREFDVSQVMNEIKNQNISDIELKTNASVLVYINL